MRATKKAKRHLTEDDIEKLKAYLEQVEFFRKLNLPLHPIKPNWMAEQHAREISGWLSIYEHGTDEQLKFRAERNLMNFI